MQTVRRSIRRSGLVARVKRKKPLLSALHQQRRLEFAKKYQNWTSWRLVKGYIFWRVQVQLFGSDGRSYCWVKPNSGLSPTRIKPTVKHGRGSIMVWGCMTFEGVGHFCDSELYKSILSGELMKTIEFYSLKRKDVIFQHDTDPKHSPKTTKEWSFKIALGFLTGLLEVQTWTRLNTLWDEVSRRLRNTNPKPTNLKLLWDRIQDIWESIWWWRH